MIISGTTGKPKGAVHVHGGFLVKIAQEVAHQVNLYERDILYWVTDMGRIMGPWEVVGGLALGDTVLRRQALGHGRAPQDLYYRGLAHIDAEGFWYLHGCSDDTIKITGKRIGPAEIESIVEWAMGW